MPLVPAILFGLLQATDWHLPPLRPGTVQRIQVDPKIDSATRARLQAIGDERGEWIELRYHARWRVALAIEATARSEFGLLLEVRDENGVVLAADRDHESETHVAVTVALEAGACVRVRVGAAAPDEGGQLDLESKEAPDQATVMARTMTAAGDPATLTSRQAAARTKADQFLAEGDAASDRFNLGGAEAAYRHAIELLAPVSPGDDRLLVVTRMALAILRFERNANDFALSELEDALEAAERCDAIPPENVVRLRYTLAKALDRQGDADAARLVYRVALRDAETDCPPGDDTPVRVRLDYAFALLECGEILRARDITERTLAAVLASRPPGHDLRLQARGTLVTILEACGDLTGALALQEEDVAEIEQARPADDFDILSQRLLLARLEAATGDHARAHERQRDIVAKLEPRLPESLELLQVARGDLASTEYRLGLLAEARTHFEQMLATAAEHHIHDATVNAARANLAVVFGLLGDLQKERALEESALREREQSAPRGETGVIELRDNLARTLAILADRDALAAQLDLLAQEIDAALATRPPLSFREVGEAMAEYEHPLATLLSFGPPAGVARLAPWSFECIESLRAFTSGAGLVPSTESDLELDACRARVREMRRAVLVAAARMRDPGAPDAGRKSAFTEAARLRDEAEHRLAAALERHGRRAVAIRLQDVAHALAPDAAAVGFRTYTRYVATPAEPTKYAVEESLLAHVVLADASLHRVELGPIARIDDAVQRWRERALASGAKASAGADADAAGRELFDLVLAPVLAACPKANVLHVCLDGELFLVPLDALPMPDGHLVGERHRVRLLSSFASLVAPPPPCTTKPSLVLFGGIDYGAAPVRTAPRFPPLAATQSEIGAIAELFHATFAADPIVGSGAQATRASLRELGPGCRWLHLATHGWVQAEEAARGPDSRKKDGSRAADDARRQLQQPLRQRVRGLAPMTLCGLALAGANRGGDEQGDAPGLVTAEELAGLDLSRCELVVLSACDTDVGVGIRRAGQGLQSLQAALHAAGARSAITSLWKASDLATHDLMIEFYRGLWRDRLGAAEALWKAKMALRAEGAPVAKWAGWVLSGAAE